MGIEYPGTGNPYRLFSRGDGLPSQSGFGPKILTPVVLGCIVFFRNSTSTSPVTMRGNVSSRTRLFPSAAVPMFAIAHPVQSLFTSLGGGAFSLSDATSLGPQALVVYWACSVCYHLITFLLYALSSALRASATDCVVSLRSASACLLDYLSG